VGFGLLWANVGKKLFPQPGLGGWGKGIALISCITNGFLWQHVEIYFGETNYLYEPVVIVVDIMPFIQRKFPNLI
jgi:hypothetical protein